MSDKRKVLIQFDCDQHASVFDSIVAIDSDIDHLIRIPMMEPIDVRDLVHGAMFTRGGDDLRRTAIFIGGSNVSLAENVLKSVTDCFFGPVRVSVMLDANGANTTASAAVIRASQHMELAGSTFCVAGATGSVGNRICRLLAGAGSKVFVGSRSENRALKVCKQIQNQFEGADLRPFSTDSVPSTQAALDQSHALISSGAAGIELITRNQWTSADSLQVVIDLNAVPPAGVAGVDPMDKARSESDKILYGAIGVGSLKMKIHKQCLKRLFESNDVVLDIDEIYQTGLSLA